jgi:deoxyribodipyrimidine photolyase-related protein
MTRLRLILGDQLNQQHSWFATIEPDTHYLMMEVRQETDYVLHHAQKVIAVFAAMRQMAKHLRAQGHQVHYLHIDDAHNTHNIVENLQVFAKELKATTIQYQAPDEWRLHAQLQALADSSSIPVQCVDSEHFLSEPAFAAKLFGNRKRWVMEPFYRAMRQRHGVLMQGDQPEGGQWNYDAENRKPWRGDPAAPTDRRARHDHRVLWQTIQACGVQTFGQAQADSFAWPIDRAEALQQLEHFMTHVLGHFGDYQDAMSSDQPFLFHSLLSFALNTKMLHPLEVIQAAERAWRDGQVPLAATEGFIRQILGWREYVRAVYWHEMPQYTERNELAHEQPLPAWFWTGQTRMRCLAQSIGQSLQTAYAHHIQRLMVIGNFALLAGLQPQAVHRWYLGIYIDAFEWVEAPNTLGMSQYADGGLLATKPYVSSAAYINRMSNYCKGCHYDHRARLGEKACPFNALYWDFYMTHEAKFSNNPRIGMAYRQLAKMTQQQRQDIREQAVFWRDNLDNL